MEALHISDADTDVFHVDPHVICEIMKRHVLRMQRFDTYPLDVLRKATALETTAWHETGHAVAYEAAGIPCFKLQIFDPDQAERLGFYGWAFVPTYPGPVNRYPSDILKACACGWLGGLAAEIALLKDRTLAEASVAPELYGVELHLAIAGALDRFEEFLALAQSALQEHHAVHAALAKRLLDRRRLKRADVSKVVAPIRRAVKPFDVTSWDPPSTPQTPRVLEFYSAGTVCMVNA